MARKEKKYHFIYKTTNLLNGKYYIGMHSTSDLEDGYMGSGKRLKRSLNKHGRENHKVEILEFFPNRKKLKEREKEIVNMNEISKKECMNIMIGGEGGYISNAHYKKMRKGASIFLKEQWKDEEYRKKRIDESAARMKQHHENGKIKYDTFTGKAHSKETKVLMSKLKKGKYIGESNSQFGTCWIYKNDENKKINKNELDQFIKEGWIKGRKINLGPRDNNGKFLKSNE
jgi:hypothetical protein